MSGMAGVGKTTARIELGHDAKIREHFKDGVLFMSLGAEATAMKITGELDEIMRMTGATTSAAKVKKISG